MTISYFFDPYPPTLISAGNTIILVVLGIGVLVSVCAWVTARILKHDPPRKRFIMRIAQGAAAGVCVGGVLYFFRLQRVYFLSTPIIAAAVIGGMIAWSFRSLYVNFKRMRTDEKARRLKEMKERYFP